MMMPRFFCDITLQPGEMDLPERAARHVQVLRLQPGVEITLFDGAGGEWQAVITDMRKRVAVEVKTHHAIEREAAKHITLALGMPANERMDWLIEKATELGVAAIQPLISERSVLRLSGERAEKKLAHWRSVAIAACEQCGRNRVPVISAVQAYEAWLHGMDKGPFQARFILSTRQGKSLSAVSSDKILFLSGPEGGLSDKEEQLAIDTGFIPLSLGPRILRAETAPLAVLSLLNIST